MQLQVRCAVVDELRSYQGDITYDAAGRSIRTSDVMTPSNGLTRGYDAENHLVSQIYAGPSGNYQCPASVCPGQTGDSTPPTTLPNGDGVNYGWSPSGHLLSAMSPLGSGTTGTFEHWDGDSVLYEQSVLNGAPNGGDIQVGKLGVTGNGLTVTDRDMSGNVVATHDAEDFSGWSDSRPFKVISKLEGVATVPSQGGSLMNSSEIYATGALNASREDGYADIWGNVFQGVRVYDPTMAQWTAPDAYAGDVHDPVSQKPFMWNGNNPLDFEDPSGYTPAGRYATNAATGRQTITLTYKCLYRKWIGERERPRGHPKE